MKLTTVSAALMCGLTIATLILLRPLMPIDETRYLAVAWEMYQGGSTLVPHLNGALYAHKPPLLFWLIDLVWLIGGVSTFGARLVAPAFAVAAVVLTGQVARRLWPDQPWRAGRAALILAVSPAFLLYGSATMFDSMLTVATLLAVMAIWWATRRDGIAPWLGLAFALAFGVYAKGPVILIHVLPVALSMPIWAAREGRPLARRWYRGLGIALVAATLIVSLWLVPALVLGGADYRAEVLWRQSAGRMVSSFAHQRPAWFFLALLPLILWPFGWTVAGLAALRPRKLLAAAPGRMISVWLLGALAVFSLISGKQTHYLLPELPALALLLSGAVPGRLGRRRELWVVLPLVAVALVIIAAWAGGVPALASMDFRLPTGAMLLGMTAAAAGVVGFLCLNAWPIRLGALPLGLVMALHFAAQPLLFQRYDVTALGTAIAPFDGKGIAITESRYPAQFNYAARLRNPVAQLTDDAQIATWLARHPEGILLSRDTKAPAGMQAVSSIPYRSDTIILYRPVKARQ